MSSLNAEFGRQIERIRRALSSCAPIQRFTAAPPRDSWHGTLNGYVHYGCRCGACKRANANRAARQRAQQRGVRVRLREHSTAAHGTLTRYVARCRCEQCRAANSAYQRQYALRRKFLATHQPPPENAA